MIGQKRYRIADLLKVVDNELSTTFHTMFVMLPLLGVQDSIVTDLERTIQNIIPPTTLSWNQSQ